MAKLTLSADPKVIREAKKFAKANHTSLSAMLERYMRIITRKRDQDEQIGPLTRRATGLIRAPLSKSDRELIEEAIMEKHGLE